MNGQSLSILMTLHITNSGDPMPEIRRARPEVIVVRPEVGGSKARVAVTLLLGEKLHVLALIKKI